ncbi:YbaB/EbfC family nucleoid-associated protein [Candidatus Peregrinibacteria bacterium]|nr:YbaB/EbfC family nucleoid-associated protein [Candidatus Peregrinibacteria bacterium]
MKKMLALQKKAKDIQEKLGNTHIEADEGEFTVTINGKQEVVDIKQNGQSMSGLVKALNKAMKKSQEIAAHEMKEVMGGLGLPGMGS